MQFSTYNESSLHRTIKLFYAETYSGQTEVSLNGHIYDIITKNKNAIEIQTRNLSSLYSKIKDTIEKGMNIKVVHPIPVSTTIELYDKNDNLISKRKSPKKGSIYDIFNELTKIYTFVCNKHFSLEVPLINISERREQTDKPVQSKNGRRRFRKNWIKTDKKLIEILDTTRFDTKESFLSLLPQTLPKEFSAKELSKCLKEEKLAPARIYNNSNIILWILVRMGFIKETSIKNRSHYYTVL